MLHIRWVTDIHNMAEADRFGVDTRQHRADTHRHLESFTKAALADKPDIIINTGDDIQTMVNAQADETLQREFLDLWSPIASNSVRLAGNHDVASFQPGELSARFGFASSLFMQKFKDATVIAWNADPTPLSGGGRTFYTASPENLFDLEMALDNVAPGKPVLLFSHIPPRLHEDIVPVDDGERRDPARSYYHNREDILKLIQERQVRLISFAGHRHVTTGQSFSNKIDLITLDRFVRQSDQPQRNAGVHTSDIFIDRGEINVYLHGRDSRVLKF